MNLGGFQSKEALARVERIEANQKVILQALSLIVRVTRTSRMKMPHDDRRLGESITQALSNIVED